MLISMLWYGCCGWLSRVFKSYCLIPSGMDNLIPSQGRMRDFFQFFGVNTCAFSLGPALLLCAQHMLSLVRMLNILYTVFTFC